MEEDKITTPIEFEKILISLFNYPKSLKLLNVGAKSGINRDYEWVLNLSKNVEVFSLEYDKTYVNPDDDHHYYGDICDCKIINDNSFDIVYVVNVFEHVKEPWKAAEECIRICRPGGVILINAPFAWYYHEHPVDFWRFTPDGLEYLFIKDNKVLTLDKGFKGNGWFQKKERFKGTGLESIYLGQKK